MSVLGFRKEGAPSLLRPSYQLLALSFQFFFFPTELEKREVGRGRILENTGVCVRSGVLSPPPPSLCPQPCSGEGGAALYLRSVPTGVDLHENERGWRGGLVLGSLGIFLLLSLPSGRPAAAAAPAKVILCFGTGRQNLLRFISEGSGKEWEPC